VRATPGVRVATEPYLTSYPAPDGKGSIAVRFSAVWDPDGYFVELNQLLGPAAGTRGATSRGRPRPNPGVPVSNPQGRVAARGA